MDSKTRPTKRAISFGINYYGTSYELRGCINDCNAIRKILTERCGFDPKNIELVTDSPQNKIKPTRDIILQKLKEYVNKTKKGDTLFVHYSGHGSYIRDVEGDEIDQKDEVICPCDNSIIKDDELYEILVKNFPKGARLICVFDCCHSGSALDLPLRYTHSNTFVNENKIRYDDKDKFIIMISGCLDDQTSADAYINGYKGALTWAFTNTLESLKSVKPSSVPIGSVGDWSWKEFINLIRYKLRNKRFEQIPQINTLNEKLLDEKVLI